MRKLFSLIFIAAMLVVSVMVVQPVAASTADVVVKNETVSTTFNRKWVWDILKTGSAANLLLSSGQTANVDYAVTVTGVPLDSGWSVTGTVSFVNRGTTDVTVNSVLVDITGGIQVVPTCTTPPGYPPIIHPGYSVICSYATALPDGSSRTSIATVTTNAGSVSSTAAINFGSPVSVVGQTINVTDTYAGSLGQVTGSASPTVVTFNYNRMVGPYNVCGDYLLTNKAVIVETGQSSDWDVNVNVPCASSCTLTQGYWKTHSQIGPAPYDVAWQNVGPQQEQTTFFLSGASWYDVFWTAPRGNPYFILAHQYMAAKLNILDGATPTPAVSAAIAYAESFFNTYSPTSTFSNSVRNQAIANANTLDQFNNGVIGPGHCSE